MTISLDDYDQNMTMVALCMNTRCVGLHGCSKCFAYAPPAQESMTIKDYRTYQLHQLIGISNEKL
jgi:hypothetical protein